MRIDAHQHFWKYTPERDTWITDEMRVLQQDFLPANFSSVLTSQKVDGCVLVQTNQSIEETNFLLQLAKEHNFIKGVVGWVDFLAEDIAEQLLNYQKEPLLKGFRHIVQAEPEGFLLAPQFIKGVQALRAFGFTYDILIYQHQLAEAVQFASALPNQRLIIDHLAKPTFLQPDSFSTWKTHMRALAKMPHVWCKVSGLITEAQWDTWKPSDFRAHLDFVAETFGVERLLFGSDWPVCTLAGSYERVIGLIEDWALQFSFTERELLFGLNAVHFYQLR